MISYRLVSTLSVLLSIFLLLGCEKKKGDAITAPNPVDTTSVAFVPPVTTILQGPSNNQIINSPSATLQWSGSKDVVRFEISINGLAWISTTEKTFTYDFLDEGTYTVIIRSIHQNGTIEKNPPSRIFTVDAVTKENSLIFFRRKNLTAALNSFSTYDIRCENFKNVAGLQLTLQYNSQQVEISDAIGMTGSIFPKSGMTGDPLVSNPSAGKKIINIVALPSSKNIPFGVTGSDLLLTLSVKPKVKGQIPITIVTAETFLRDSSNTNLIKGEFVNGLIEVQ